MFDVFNIASHGVMAAYYYYIEYKERFEYFSQLKQSEVHASYKKLLDALPTGIILLEESTNFPVFYNDHVEHMIRAKTRPEEQHRDKHKSRDNLDTVKEVANARSLC
jgi:hypothetical protein